MNFTRVLGSSLEIRGEFARRSGSESIADPASGHPLLLSHKQRTAVLLGGKYTHHGGVQGIFEFFTSGGLPRVTAPQVTAPGASVPTGRQGYAFARIGKSRLRELPGWKDWDVGAMMLASLSDGSRPLIFDVERRVGHRFVAYGRAPLPGGRRGQSEYSMIPYQAELAIGCPFHIW